MLEAEEFHVVSSAHLRRPRFGKIPAAVAYSGISRSRLYEIAGANTGLFKKWARARLSTSTCSTSFSIGCRSLKLRHARLENRTLFLFTLDRREQLNAPVAAWRQAWHDFSYPARRQLRCRSGAFNHVRGRRQRRRSRLNSPRSPRSRNSPRSPSPFGPQVGSGPAILLCIGSAVSSGSRRPTWRAFMAQHREG